MRKALSKKLRFEVFKRDGFRCVYCGATPLQSPLHVDHVIAVAEGGTNAHENLATACDACNLGKGARPLGATLPERRGPRVRLTPPDRVLEWLCLADDGWVCFGAIPDPAALVAAALQIRHDKKVLRAVGELMAHTGPDVRFWAHLKALLSLIGFQPDEWVNKVLAARTAEVVQPAAAGVH